MRAIYDNDGQPRTQSATASIREKREEKERAAEKENSRNAGAVRRAVEGASDEAEVIARELLDNGMWLELREEAREGSEAKYAVFNNDGVLMAMVRGRAKAEAAAAAIAKDGTYTVR